MTLWYFISGKLSLSENANGRAGLMSDFVVECSECQTSTNMSTSRTTTDKGRSFDVNRRAMYHALETGGGYESLFSFCSIMNMPCMSKQAYYNQVDIILEAQEAEAEAELLKAGEKLKKLHKQDDTDLDTDLDSNESSQHGDGITDVTVSFDGTWAKRGFTSLFGVFFVMSVDTGEVLDYHIYSKFCQKCSKKQHDCKDNMEKLEAWKIQHVANGLNVLKRLSVPGGKQTEVICSSKDKKRVAKSDLQTSEKFKRRREGIHQLKLQREEALRDAEGVSYEAGGF